MDPRDAHREAIFLRAVEERRQFVPCGDTWEEGVIERHLTVRSEGYAPVEGPVEKGAVRRYHCPLCLMEDLKGRAKGRRQAGGVVVDAYPPALCCIACSETGRNTSWFKCTQCPAWLCGSCFASYAHFPHALAPVVFEAASETPVLPFRSPSPETLSIAPNSSIMSPIEKDRRRKRKPRFCCCIGVDEVEEEKEEEMVAERVEKVKESGANPRTQKKAGWLRKQRKVSALVQHMVKKHGDETMCTACPVCAVWPVGTLAAHMVEVHGKKGASQMLALYTIRFSAVTIPFDFLYTADLVIAHAGQTPAQRRERSERRDREGRCSICNASVFTSLEAVVILACQHLMHAKCIQSGAPCPLCTDLEELEED